MSAAKPQPRMVRATIKMEIQDAHGNYMTLDTATITAMHKPARETTFAFLVDLFEGLPDLVLPTLQREVK